MSKCLDQSDRYTRSSGKTNAFEDVQVDGPDIMEITSNILEGSNEGTEGLDTIHIEQGGLQEAGNEPIETADGQLQNDINQAETEQSPSPRHETSIAIIMDKIKTFRTRADLQPLARLLASEDGISGKANTGYGQIRPIPSSHDPGEVAHTSATTVQRPDTSTSEVDAQDTQSQADPVEPRVSEEELTPRPAPKLQAHILTRCARGLAHQYVDVDLTTNDGDKQQIFKTEHKTSIDLTMDDDVKPQVSKPKRGATIDLTMDTEYSPHFKSERGMTIDLTSDTDLDVRTSAPRGRMSREYRRSSDLRKKLKTLESQKRILELEMEIRETREQLAKQVKMEAPALLVKKEETVERD